MTNESSTHSRRAVIAAGGCSVASLAGCSALQSDPPMLDIVFRNHTDSRYIITGYLLASGGMNSNENAETFLGPIEIEPQEVVRREDIAETQQYVIEYDVDKIVNGDPLQTDRDHAHFIPSNDEDTPSVTFDIIGSGTLNKSNLNWG